MLTSGVWNQTEQGQAKEGDPPRRYDRGRPLSRRAHRRRRVDLLPLGGRGHRRARRAGPTDEGEAGQRVLVNGKSAERVTKRLSGRVCTEYACLGPWAPCARSDTVCVHLGAPRAHFCQVYLWNRGPRILRSPNHPRGASKRVMLI